MALFLGLSTLRTTPPIDVDSRVGYDIPPVVIVVETTEVIRSGLVVVVLACAVPGWFARAVVLAWLHVSNSPLATSGADAEA